MPMGHTMKASLIHEIWLCVCSLIALEPICTKLGILISRKRLENCLISSHCEDRSCSSKGRGDNGSTVTIRKRLSCVRVLVKKIFCISVTKNGTKTTKLQKLRSETQELTRAQDDGFWNNNIWYSTMSMLLSGIEPRSSCHVAIRSIELTNKGIDVTESRPAVPAT